MKFLFAIAKSLAFHVALAIVLAIYLHKFSKEKEVAKLDLSSVEISFATEESPNDPIATSEESIASDSLPMPTIRELEMPKLTDSSSEIKIASDPPIATANELRDIAPRESPAKMDLPEKKEETTIQTEAVASAAPRQAKVDAEAKPQKTIEPKYPEGSRRRHEEGVVQLSFVVDAGGRARDVKVDQSSGYRELDQAAKSAVKSAKFDPATRDGNFVESKATITITFKLNKPIQ